MEPTDMERSDKKSTVQMSMKKKLSVEFTGDSSVKIEKIPDTPIPRHLMLVVTPASNENVTARTGSLQLPRSDDSDESDVWETPAPMGLLTSESPDCVAAWRGRQRPSRYGKPFLTCDRASRVLVLPEPVYMMWPKWMNMGFAAAAQQVSDTDVAQSERSNQISTSGSFVKGGNVRKLSAGDRQTSRRRTSRVARSSYTPTRYSLESSSAEVVPPQPPKPPWLLEETEQ